MESHPEKEPLVVSIEIAARLLGLGRSSAYAAAKRGEIPAIKIGGRLLVPKAALLRLLDGGGRTSHE